MMQGNLGVIYFAKFDNFAQQENLSFIFILSLDTVPTKLLVTTKVVFTPYRIVKRSVAKCVSDRASVYTGNASSGTIFAP